LEHLVLVDSHSDCIDLDDDVSFSLNLIFVVHFLQQLVLLRIEQLHPVLLHQH
jgi:hypothetical protein